VIGRFGGLALAAGIVVAVLATLLWLRIALAPPAAAAARHARRATWVALIAAGAACVALEWALLTHDFSVRYVAENGARDVALYYTVTSLWAAQDGSLLLWLLILAAYGVALARTVPATAAALHPWTMTVVSAVTVFFFALAYFGANPFQGVHPMPADGPGPNPLLREHPAMGIHPPLLYAGYIGMVVPFGYAVAALARGEAGPGWLAATRRWTLLAWSCLTAGIALGAWWSYAVLGWGGYWAWDPVENASLLPWLTATALLHTALARRRRPALTGWTVALAGASFLLVLVGTFLTRSGALDSVHAFARSPVGPMLLGFVMLSAAVVTGLAVWRADRFAAAPVGGAGLSRERILLANAVLFVALTAIVLTGTVFPLLSDALAGTRSAVGPAYFDRTAVPVALAVLLLMGAAPLLRWGGDGAGEVARRLAPSAAAGLATVAVVGLLTRPSLTVLAALGLAAFVLTTTVVLAATDLRGARTAASRQASGGRPPVRWQRRRRYGGLVAHAGIAIVAAGIAASSGYTMAVERQLGVGQSMTVAGVTARLTGVRRDGGPGGMTATATLRLDRGGHRVGISRPGLRYHPARDMTVSLPAITSRPTGDVYTTLTAVTEDGATATVRLAVNPLVGLVWLGGAVTALGGLLALDRRPRTRPDRPAAEPAPEPAPLAASQ
jgi:cytochrome c-type biogenesis protein CcmF